MITDPGAYRLSIMVRKDFVNKNINNINLGKGWKPVDYTVTEVMEHISKGYAFTQPMKELCLCYGDGHHCGTTTKTGRIKVKPIAFHKVTANLAALSYIGLDFDHETDFSVLEHPFIRGHAHLWYTTPSHLKPNDKGEIFHKFRVMIFLAEPQEGVAWARQILRSIKRLFPQADQSCFNLDRYFNGSTIGNPTFVPGPELSTKELELLAGQTVTQPNEEITLTGEKRKKRTPLQRKALAKKVEQLIVKYWVPAKNPNANWGFGDVDLASEMPDGRVEVTSYNGYSMWISVCWSLLEMFEGEVETVAALLDKYQPAQGMTTLEKVAQLAASAEGRKDIRVTEKRFWDVCRHYGWQPDSDVVGQSKITADVKIHERYLDYDFLSKLSAKCIIIKSPKNSGKTTVMRQFVDAYERVVTVAPLCGLVKNQAGKFEIDYYQSVNPAETTRIAVTLQSLHKIDPKRQMFDLFMVDEFEQVMNAWVGGTMEGKQDKTLNRFRWLSATAAKVILADADMSDDAVEFMSQIVGRQNIVVVENDYHEGGKTFQIRATKEDIVAQAIQLLKEGKKLAITSNSAIFCRSLYQLLQDELPALRGAVVSQENSQDPQVQEWIETIDTWVTEQDYFIYSPSLGTGVDINPPGGHFDQVLLVAEGGVNTHLDLLQQIARVRIVRENIVQCYISPEEGERVTDRELLREFSIENNRETGVRLTTNELWEDVPADEGHTFLWVSVNARRNTSINKLKKNFLKAVKQEGHHVVFLDSDRQARKRAKNHLREAKGQVKKDWEDRVTAARVIGGIEYQELVLKRKVDISSRAAMLRYEINDFYGQEVTGELVALDDEGRFRDNVISYEVNTALTDAENLDQKERTVKKVGTSERPDIRTPHAQRHHYVLKVEFINEILTRSGLGALKGCAGPEWAKDKAVSKDSLIANGFVAWLNAPEQRTRSLRVLDLKVPDMLEDTAVRYLQSVLALMGLELHSTRKRIEGKLSWVYTVDQEKTKLMWSIAQQRAHRRALELGVANATGFSLEGVGARGFEVDLRDGRGMQGLKIPAGDNVPAESYI